MIDFLSASKDVLSDWLSVRPEVFFWWLLVEVIGLITFPVAFVFLGRLPDRGYSFAKALGLILLGFFLFIGATVGVIANSRGGVLLILLLMAIVAAVIVARRRDELAKFLAERWAYVLLVEGLFAVAFITAAWLRSYVPDINGTEKPTEFAIFNAVLRSDQFPAHDPWLAGHDLSYYYFGYVIFGGLTKLLGTAAAVAFNLGLALTAALTAMTVFGVVYNLVAARGTRRRGVIFGLAGVVLLLFLANLEGVFEVMAAQGIGPAALYRWVEVDGLALGKSTGEWYPDEFFWWWRATRIPSGWDIEEFPFFSFLLGDLHPHVMAIPFTLLAVGVVFNLLRTQAVLNAGWALRNWASFALLVIVLGGLSFLHSWSLPPILLLLATAVFARNWWQRGHNFGKATVDTASIILLVAAGSVLFYLPFYWTSGGGLWPPAPVEAVARPDYLPLWSLVTPPKHLFIGWGPLLWLAFGIGVALVSGRWLRRLGWHLGLALLPALIPLAVWALLALGHLGPVGFWDELTLRGSNLLTVALVIGLLGLLTLAALRFFLAREGEPREVPFLALTAMAIAMLLILGVELFYSFDRGQGTRGNTVFKLYYQAWILLSLGIPVGLHYIVSRLPRPTWPRSLGSLGHRAATFTWGATALALVLAALVYPLTATFARTNGFTNAQTLDGLAFLQNANRFEYDAIQWLANNVEGSPVVLEAVGDPYTQGGRVSSRTGLPTLLEWPTHEQQWRGSTGPLGNRRAEVELLYRTLDLGEAMAILERHDIEYVYVGDFERQQYGEAGLAKFAEFMVVAYQNPDVTIYRVPGAVGQVTAIGSAE